MLHLRPYLPQVQSKHKIANKTLGSKATQENPAPWPLMSCMGQDPIRERQGIRTWAIYQSCVAGVKEYSGLRNCRPEPDKAPH